MCVYEVLWASLTITDVGLVLVVPGDRFSPPASCSPTLESKWQHRQRGWSHYSIAFASFVLAILFFFLCVCDVLWCANSLCLYSDASSLGCPLQSRRRRGNRPHFHLPPKPSTSKKWSTGWDGGHTVQDKNKFLKLKITRGITNP